MGWRSMPACRRRAAPLQRRRAKPVVWWSPCQAGAQQCCAPTGKCVLEGEEILQELLAGLGQHGFGMELHAFEFVAAVADAHDDAVVGFGGGGDAREEGV